MASVTIPRVTVKSARKSSSPRRDRRKARKILRETAMEYRPVPMKPELAPWVGKALVAASAVTTGWLESCEIHRADNGAAYQSRHENDAADRGRWAGLAATIAVLARREYTFTPTPEDLDFAAHLFADPSAAREGEQAPDEAMDWTSDRLADGLIDLADDFERRGGPLASFVARLLMAVADDCQVFECRTFPEWDGRHRQMIETQADCRTCQEQAYRDKF